MIPVSVASRKVKAIWDIASQAGIRVDVVSWYGSWPVETVNGTFVGSFSYKGGTGGAVPITQSFSFGAITPPAGKVTFRVTGNTTVCPGGGTWGFNTGGSFKMY